MSKPSVPPTIYPSLGDVVNTKVLRRHLSSGLIVAGTHDVLPLWVYDYTALCERRRSWDQVTTTCRGLVRDNKGLVVARPFQKFLGWGQKSTSALRATRWSDHWYATEKVDGTMITASNYHGHLLLATRRTFDAWQLSRVRELWPAGLLPDMGTTWVLEYVGPENRIVVFYPDEALYGIGAIDNTTGADLATVLTEMHRSGFRAPKLYEAAGPEDLLKLENNDARHEGFVVVWLRKGAPSGRLKVKYPSYNAVHSAARTRR
jgi:RNA ligase